MFHKTEESIIQHWKFDPIKPIVSICCITYNQKDYIEQAIDSFLMQETDFPFEILIHDDASTDGTAGIVKAYAAKYPNLIRTVLQLKNQYSQNTIITPRFLWPIAKGEYIAMCEGDDYWTSPIKLNTQVNIMNQFPDVSMSFHAALVLNENDRDIASEIGQFGDKLKVFSQKYVIEKGGGLCATSSVVYRTSTLRSFPSWFYKVSTGDYFTQILASKSGALYFPDQFSVYRSHSNGSHSSRMKTSLKIFISMVSKNIKGLAMFLFSSFACDLSTRMQALNAILRRFIYVLKESVKRRLKS